MTPMLLEENTRGRSAWPWVQHPDSSTEQGPKPACGSYTPKALRPGEQQVCQPRSPSPALGVSTLGI